ncbi:MAG: amidohydrolase family protein [Acidobacteriota bacterium]
MTLIHLRNATVLDCTRQEPRPGCDVVVEHGTIREVSDVPIKLAAAETLDLNGRTLMPGLIDAHMHAIAVAVNLATLSDVPMSLVALEAHEILEGMLRRGFTSVRDAGGADRGLAEAVERGLIAGPRMFVSGRALSQTGGHGDLRSPTAGLDSCACCQAGAGLARIADGVAEVRRAARDELRKGASQIKIMASGGVASPTDPIWNLQYSEEEVRAIVEEAAHWRTYVMAHAYTPAAIRRSIDFGVRSIEHANLIDSDTASHAAASGVFVVPTLVTYDALEKQGKALGLPEVSLAKLKDVRAAGLQSLERLQAAGVKIGFGTDLLGAMHEHQSREFLIRAEAMTPFEAIRSATLVNAELLQMTGKLGVVAPGAIADLLVVNGNPLENLGLLQDQGAHLAAIMKGGRFFKQTLR